VVVALGSMVVLAACGSPDSPSILDARGPGEARIVALWWFMFGVSVFVIALVTFLILLGVFPRRRAHRAGIDETPPWSKALIVGVGLVFSVVVLTALWIWTLGTLHAQSEPPRPATLQITVTGYEWWWRVDYPGLGITTANDIHIPSGEAVRVTLRTVDVIHSLWVPQLQGKTDLVSGRVNRTWWQADHPGVYRGQCAEYCGLQHANMAFYVVADPPADFQAWVAKERRPAAAPSASNFSHGQEVFLSQPCVACHTIKGVSEASPGTALEQFGLHYPTTAVIGPDLTHFGGRRTIGAGAAPNTEGFLGGWIVDSQGIKPGNHMPPIELPARDLQDLIDYLESLE
jgi:cytochrome c oxidase subunit II